MSRVQLLSDEVASQVAAGEVIERPASVVKELVENSIDAGATRIEVRTDRGGIALMRVVDNGCGMSRDDAALAIQRHATSKIRTGNDLASVTTLGFRGEALPSIASVSKFLLSTREHGAVAGTEVRVAGGRVEAVRDGGEAPGTVIEVRTLFFNLPARKKFLRTEATEGSHIDHQLQLLALAHPAIAVSHVKDGRLVFRLPAKDTLEERIRSLLGREIAGGLLELRDAGHNAARLTGFIGRPGLTRSTRSQMHCFVNGRAVDNPAILHGVREGYHTALPKGHYPVAFLFLEISPGDVDVNVHPAKREVRFRNQTAVRDAVAETVRRSLVETRPATTVFSPAPPRHDTPRRGGAPAQPPSEAAVPVPSAVAVPIPQRQPPLSAPEPAPATSDAPGAPAPDFRWIGFLGGKYALMESGEGLVMLDMRSARERVLFEKLRAQLARENIPQQRLLLAPVIELPPRDADWIRLNLPALQRLGIGLEEFGPDTFKLEGLPQWLRPDDPAALVRQMIDAMGAAGGSASRVRLEEDKLVAQVCHLASREDAPRTESATRNLLQSLFECELPYCCPRGRPTLVQISFSELQRKFGKI